MELAQSTASASVDEGGVLRAEVQRSCERLQQLESTVDLLQRRLDEWGRLTLEMQAGLTDVRLKAVAFENSAARVHQQTRDIFPAEGIVCKMSGEPDAAAETGGPWYARQRRNSRVEADLPPREDSAVAEDRSTGESCATEA